MLNRFLTAALASILLLAAPASATTLTIPNTFNAHTTAQSGQVNGNFTAVSNWANGSIDNGNIAGGANISPSKFNFTLEYGPVLRAAAADCFAVGNTGDTVPRWKVTSDGKVFYGAGGASAVDLCAKRESAGVMAVRNGADNAYADIKAANITASGTITGLGIPQHATGTITSAQIKLMQSAPVVVIPAAGANTVIDVIAGCAKYVFGTVQYTTGGAISCLYTSGQLAMSNPSFLTTLTGVNNLHAIQLASQTVQAGLDAGYQNVGVELKNVGGGGEYAAGDGVLEYDFLYRVVQY